MVIVRESMSQPRMRLNVDQPGSVALQEFLDGGWFLTCGRVGHVERPEDCVNRLEGGAENLPLLVLRLRQQ
jgi:hypothetical protein